MILQLVAIRKKSVLTMFILVCVQRIRFRGETCLGGLCLLPTFCPGTEWFDRVGRVDV